MTCDVPSALIVVPTIGALPLEAIATNLQRLVQGWPTSHNHVVAYVVVNFRPADATRDACMASTRRVEYLWQERNLGFGGSVRQAVEQYRESASRLPDFTFVVNDDLIFSDNFDAGDLFHDIDSGLAVAFTMEAGTTLDIPSTGAMQTFLRLSTLSRSRFIRQIASPERNLTYPNGPSIPGFALVRIPGSLWANLDGFDGRFQHYYEDLDFAIRAARAGKPVRVQHVYGVNHLRGASRSLAPADVLAVEVQAAFRFLRKWGHSGVRAFGSLSCALMVRLMLRLAAGKLRLAIREAGLLRKLLESWGAPTLPYLCEMAHDQGAEWPPRSMETQAACSACACELDSACEFTNLVDELYGVPGRWSLQRCTSCCTLVLNPRPTAASLPDAYLNYYTHQVVGSRPSSNRLLRWIKRFETHLSQKVTTCQVQARKSRLLAILTEVDIVRAVLMARSRGAIYLAPRSERHLLDVGCGDGRYMARAEGLGWKTRGLDLDPKAVEAARGRNLDVRHCGIEELTAKQGTYDLITISHVLEHVLDPQELLIRAAGLLREGGYLWIQTPNVSAPGLRRYGSDWRGLEPPRHLAIFSRSAVLGLLRTAGLTVECTRAWQPVAWSTYRESRRQSCGGRSGVLSRSWHAAVGLRDDLRCYFGTLEDEFVTVIATKK